MNIVNDDLAYEPIPLDLFPYFAAVSSVVVVYDWALTFGQEFELVWRRPWSFMAILYICVRYIGIPYSVIIVLSYLPISVTDVVSLIFYFILIWTPVVVNAMLGIIMMIRIHAMYGRSKKMLVFLVIVLLVSTISSVCFTAITGNIVSVDDFSSYYMCYPTYSYFDEGQTMNMQVESVRLMSTAIWEILAFVLAVRIVIKHFRELRYSPTGPTIGDCFMVLAKSHTFYFVGFLVVLCFSLTSMFTYLPWTESWQNYSGVFQIAQELQMYVLGPRLILSIREYNAELVARSDEGTGMTTIHFQAGGDASTGGDV